MKKMSEVLRSDHGDCAVLTLNRPDQLNTINTALVDALERELDILATDATRGVLLTGSGRAFCVGTDLKENHGDNDAWLARIHALVERLYHFPKPLVAAINGLALGGGLEFASACLFRVAVSSAKLGLPEVKLSLIPSYGGTQLISRLIGENRALELMLGGDPITAAEAREIGLVNLVVAEGGDLVTEALAYLGRFSRHSRVAVASIRRAVSEGAALDHREALKLEARLAAEIGHSADAAEGVAAFLEKRKPVWRDR